jgi:hypothetical protein
MYSDICNYQKMLVIFPLYTTNVVILQLRSHYPMMAPTILVVKVLRSVSSELKRD